MSEVWQSFGFEDTPYRTEPLEVSLEDYKLFTGRKKEAAMFLTEMDRKTGSVVLISGDAGIGKTSFFNVQQYRITSKRAGLGFVLVPCYERTPILVGDDERSLAKRLMHNTLENIAKDCSERNVKLPKKIKEIKRWMSHEADEGGFSFDFGGFGASTSVVPRSVDEASLENWRDIFTIVAAECVSMDGVQGVTVCVDNAEEVGLEQLGRVLMAYRDTLFVIRNIWWIIIGQPNLYSRLAAHDERISERVRGPGIEIPPMASNELHELVAKRIKRYRADKDALNPLSEEIHEHLYRASRGVARFVLQAADMLVTLIVSEVKQTVLEELDDLAAPETIDTAIDEALQRILFNRRIPDHIAIEKLRELSVQMVASIQLSEIDVGFLEKIKASEVSVDQYSEYDVDSREEFQTHYLDRLTRNNLLQRRSIQGQDRYRLRSYSYLCAELEVFPRLRERIINQNDAL